MAVKASNQVTLVDLTDAYSVILSSEAHTFAGSTSSVASTQSISVVVTALCGSDPVTCSVGTCTCATGVSAAVTNNNSTAPTVTITATTACNAAGVVKIPVTIGDLSITKDFSYAIALKGSTGSAGKGISSTEVKYAASSSGTTIPTPESAWGASIPTVSEGQYLWTRTKITYTSGDPSISYSVGMKGQTGSNGKDGRGIVSTKVEYIAGTSATTAPTGTWSTSVPSVSAGQYLWTRTTHTYTSGDPTVSYSVARQGQNGAKGDTGNPGADAISLVVTSSNGVIFKNTSVATTLTAQVFKGGTEVTGNALTALGTIKWYKDGGTTAVGTGATLTVSAGDVTNSASYVAQLEA